MKAYKFIIVAAMLAGYCCGVSMAGADDESEDVINYAYSSWIGSGFYKLGDRTVYLLRGPFSCTLRETDREKWGLELLFPATIELKSSELDFGTAFTWADHSQSGGGSDNGFSMIDIGFNTRWPTHRWVSVPRRFSRP